jgi:hypothetical protein
MEFQPANYISNKWGDAICQLRGQASAVISIFQVYFDAISPWRTRDGGGGVNKWRQKASTKSSGVMYGVPLSLSV